MNATNLPAPARAYPAWRLLIVLMSMNVVAYLDRSILSLAAPAIQSDLGISHVELSLLLGLGFVLFFVVFGLPFGWLVDRFPRRWILYAGILFWSLSASAAGLANSFWTLLAARFGIGAGEAALHPSAFSMLTDAFQRRRLGFAMALYGAASGLGAAVSVAVGGIVLGLTIAHGPVSLGFIGTLQPWQFTLLLSGMPGLILAFTVFTVPEPARRDLAKHDSSAAPESVLRFMAHRWRFFVPVMAAYGTLQIGAYAFSTWQPTWMIQRFGWAIEDVGLALSIGMAGSFFGSFVAGSIVDRMAIRLPTAPLIWASGSTLFSGIFAGLAFLVDNAWQCVGLVVVAQLPIAMIGIVSMALQQVTPNQLRGQVSAIFILVVNLVGFGAGPFLPAALVDYVFEDPGALGGAIAITCFACAPVAASLLWLSRRPMRSGLDEARQWQDEEASKA